MLSARWYGLAPTFTVAATASVAVLTTVTVFELTFEVYTRLPSGDTATEFG